MGFLYYTFLALFLLVSLLLCLVILMQQSRSTGLGASFGGADSGDSLFGTATAGILKKITVWLAITFVAMCITLSVWTGAMGRSYTSQQPVESIEQ